MMSHSSANKLSFCLLFFPMEEWTTGIPFCVIITQRLFLSYIVPVRLLSFIDGFVYGLGSASHIPILLWLLLSGYSLVHSYSLPTPIFVWSYEGSLWLYPFFPLLPLWTLSCHLFIYIYIYLSWRGGSKYHEATSSLFILLYQVLHRFQ